MAESQSIDQW